MESSREILGKKSLSDNLFCQMLNIGRSRIESELRNEPELIQKSSIQLSPRISWQKRNYSSLPEKKKVIGKQPFEKMEAIPVKNCEPEVFAFS